MEELVNLLNYDVSEHIKNITVNDILTECKTLYQKYQQDKVNWPPEPTSNKKYQIWLNTTINYTSAIKPIEHDLKQYYSEIVMCRDFDTLNSKLYISFKSCLKEWYDTNSYFKNIIQ
jgi:hypothetical protein